MDSVLGAGVSPSLDPVDAQRDHFRAVADAELWRGNLTLTADASAALREIIASAAERAVADPTLQVRSAENDERLRSMIAELSASATIQAEAVVDLALLAGVVDPCPWWPFCPKGSSVAP